MNEGVFLSPCQSREIGSKPVPGQGFVMRKFCCNVCCTLGGTSRCCSTEGMGFTLWKRGTGRGPGKEVLNPCCAQPPSTELPFYHMFNLCTEALPSSGCCVCSILKLSNMFYKNMFFSFCSFFSCCKALDPTGVILSGTLLPSK